MDVEYEIKKTKFKNIFETIIQNKLPEKPCNVAVLCSGGVDSLTCVFALLELGYDPILYSFHLENYISEDFKSVQRISKILKLPLKEIIVPINNIKKDFSKLINEYNCSKKTQVECTFPWLYVFPKITEEYVITGITADSHYGLTKKCMIHYKDSKIKFNQYQKDNFNDENPECVRQLELVANKNNKKIIIPYLDKKLQKYFQQFSWDEINKPFQKYLVIMNYQNYFKLTGRRLHSNLQLNAKIPDIFLQLLDDPKINFKNRKRTMDLVRDYVKLREEKRIT